MNYLLTFTAVSLVAHIFMLALPKPLRLFLSAITGFIIGAAMLAGGGYAVYRVHALQTTGIHAIGKAVAPPMSHGLPPLLSWEMLHDISYQPVQFTDTSGNQVTFDHLQEVIKHGGIHYNDQVDVYYFKEDPKGTAIAGVGALIWYWPGALLITGFSFIMGGRKLLRRRTVGPSIAP